MRNYLLKRVFNDGPAVLRLPPDSTEVTIGRTETMTYRILSAAISRHHATLKRRNDEWYIKDNDSLNGVRVNNTLLKKSTWYHIEVGDHISFTPLEAKESYVYEVCIDMSSSPREEPETVTEAAEQTELQNKIKEMEKLLQEKDQAQKELEAKLEEMNVKRDAEIRSKIEEDRRLLEEKYQYDLELELGKKEEALMEQLQQQTRRIMEDMEDVQSRLKKDHKKELCERDNELQDKLEKERSKLNSELRQADSKMKLLKEQIKSARSNREQSSEAAAIVEREKVVKSFTEVMDMELQCSICSELFIKAVTLNCAHSFCEYCIAAWEKTNRICPICRAPVTTKSNSIVVDSFIAKICENFSQELKDKRKVLVAERNAEMEAAKKTSKPPRKKQRRSAQTAATTFNAPSTSGASASSRVRATYFVDTSATRTRPHQANRTSTTTRTTNVPPVSIPHIAVPHITVPLTRVSQPIAHRNNQPAMNVINHGIPDTTSTATTNNTTTTTATTTPAAPNPPSSPVMYISSDSDSSPTPTRRPQRGFIVVSDTEDGV